MNRLIIISTSGHGQVVADVEHLNGYKDIVSIDDDKAMYLSVDDTQLAA